MIKGSRKIIRPKSSDNIRKSVHQQPEDRAAKLSEKLRQKEADLKKETIKRKKLEKLYKESLQNNKKLFESSNDAIFIADTRTGLIIDANIKASKLIGVPIKKIIGMHQTELHPSEENKKYKEIFLEHVRKGKAFSTDTYVINSSGQRIPVEITARVTEFNGKRVISGVFRDIAWRKKREDLLRESEERYRGIVDNINIGVAVISPDMEILFINNAMKEWYPRIDTIKRPLCYKSFNKPSGKKICAYCPVVKTLKDGLIHEAVTETPAGHETRNYRLIASPVRNTAGKIISVIEIVEDITERIAAEEKILQSKKAWEDTFNTIPDIITIHDMNYNIIMANSAARDHLKLPPLKDNNVKCYKYYHGTEEPPEECPSCKSIKTGKAVVAEIFEPHMDRYIEARAIPQYDGNKHIAGIIHVVRDISEQKEAEHNLLMSEKELRIKADNLEDANTAMKVLLKQREEDRVLLEERVMQNIKTLVMPYIEKIKYKHPGKEDSDQIRMLESNLKDITSSFSKRLSSKHIGLTPREIQVANLIKEGRQSKDIAESLNTSIETVNCHRQSIRKKLGILNTKTNLRTLLLSLFD